MCIRDRFYLYLAVVLIDIFYVQQYERLLGVKPTKVLFISWDIVLSVPGSQWCVEQFRKYIDAIYNFINHYSRGHASEVIFLVPFWAASLVGTTNLKIKIKDTIVGLWASITLIYGAIYLFLSPNSVLEFVIVLTPLFWLVGTLADVEKTGRYGLLSYGRNTISRDNLNSDSDKYDAAFMRGLMLNLLIVLFWYNVRIDSSVEWQIYILSISSCLFVIGFLALIFTYAHTSFSSERIRITVQNEIETVYRVVGVTIIASFTGVLLFSKYGVDFSLTNGISVESINLAIFLIVCTGTVLAIEATIQIFREISISLPVKSQKTGSLKILFDESDGDGNLSGIDSDGLYGSSGFRDFLVDKGCEVRAISNFRLGPVLTFNPDILIIRSVLREIEKKKIDSIYRMVMQGLDLIVFYDQKDVAFKINLLKKFSISPEELQEISNTLGIWLYKKSESDDENVQYLISLEQAICLSASTKYNNLFSVEVNKTDEDTKKTMALCFGGKVGKGSVAFIGDSHAWSNKWLGVNDSIDVLEEILLNIEEERAITKKESKSVGNL